MFLVNSHDQTMFHVDYVVVLEVSYDRKTFCRVRRQRRRPRSFSAPDDVVQVHYVVTLEVSYDSTIFHVIHADYFVSFEVSQDRTTCYAIYKNYDIIPKIFTEGLCSTWSTWSTSSPAGFLMTRQFST